MLFHALVTRRFDRKEFEAFVAPGVSVSMSYVLDSKSVYTPSVASSVVLTLLLTAETFLLISLFKRDDFPAFGAPKKHALRVLAPCGESSQGI